MALDWDSLGGLFGRTGSQFGAGPARDGNPMGQPVNNVSEMISPRNMNQQGIQQEQNQLLQPQPTMQEGTNAAPENSGYQQMLQQMQSRYGQSPEQMEDIMNRVGYHESAGTSDPTLHQYGGGPGRGLFQFETGAGQGGETAMRRLHKYLGKSGQDIPDWAQIGEEGVDASQLTPEQQKMMFMANVRYHPEASLKGVTPENLGTNLWAPYHWAGAEKDKSARLGSFDESMAAYDLKNTPTANEQAFSAY